MERKFKVGDTVVLTMEGGGRLVYIEQVLPDEHPKGFHYLGTLANGSKRYGWKEEQFAGRLGEVDRNNLPAMNGGDDFAKGQALAMKQAEANDGSPDGERWLLLATANPGDTIMLRDPMGNIKPAKLVKMRLDKAGRKLLTQPFAAQYLTGGLYKWDLSSLVIGSEAPKQSGGLTITAPPVNASGTLGDLFNQCQKLMQSGVPATTPVVAASDEEGNSYNTIYDLEVSPSKKGKVVVVNVQHDNIYEDELFG